MPSQQSQQAVRGCFLGLLVATAGVLIRRLLERLRVLRPAQPNTMTEPTYDLAHAPFDRTEDTAAPPSHADSAAVPAHAAATVEPLDLTTAQSINHTATAEAAPDTQAHAHSADRTIDPQVLLQAEAVLFVAAEPVDADVLARVLGLAAAELPALRSALRQHFQSRGIRLQEQADQLQLVSAPEATAALERFLGQPQPTKLSAAALEVLAIIAYRQPLTRAQVEAIRGVDSSGVMRSLLARELIAEVGRAESLGRPILYATTAQFLQTFGLTSLDELPELALPEPPEPPAAAD